MPTAAHTSRIVVVDSAKAGASKLPHSMYSIVYLPSWLLLRERFDWSNFPHTLGIMKEYFVGAEFQERPFRAQRCLYSMKAIDIYHPDRYDKQSRILYEAHYKSINDYLRENPVVAWDWIVTWTECREMASTYPEELTRLFRKLRSIRDTKKQMRTELAYFLNIVQEVAQEKGIDMEHK